MTGEVLTQAPPLAAQGRAAVYSSLRPRILVFALLGLLATIPYLPVFVQPFVSDDYIQIDLGRKYGPIAAWGNLFEDALYRCRATSILMTHWTEQLFGTAPLAFYASSVSLHVVNAWLLLLVGRRLGMGGVRSYLAAAFFAVYRGHQEAVMWYAALPELLLFFFCGCFLLSWDAHVRRGSTVHYGLAMGSFMLALLSKEAAVVLVPIAAAMAYQRGRSVWRVAPMAVTAAIYAATIFAAGSGHLHLNDGTFSLEAPFAMTWARSIGRMFWVWGLLGVAAIALWRGRAWRSLLPAALWITVTILPFSFLMYMPVVPSRHTYLASAGVGFFVAAGLLATRARFRAHRWVLPVLLGALVAHNTGYIWVKKRQQFLERAAATEDLLRLARTTDGPIYITCFPYGPDVAEKAMEITFSQPASRLVWNTPPPPGVVTFCAKDP
ncbi:MAG: hypothetical protein ACKV2U_19970 [Bryobacteraceae bacterium]